MNEPGREPAPETQRPLDLPAPAAVRRRLPVIWLVPLVAALIGAWLAFKAYAERGPTITITFQSAEGLEAGQTRIKHKDVEVGRVTAINLSPDFSQVVVTAELNRGAYALLSENSRFWVVRARISTLGISGLGTLLGGVYIGMDPGPGGRKVRSFKGLETPPVLAPAQSGELVELQAERLGSLNLGSPVTYRQFHVGEVAGFDLGPDGRSLLVKITVHSPYDKLIRRDTRFWDAGGVDLALDANGLRLHSDSVAHLLLGGIAFETPEAPSALEPIPAGRPFTLYPSREKAFEQVYSDRHLFVMNFNESIRGLARGAPVEFRGMKVGEVKEFHLEFHARELEGRIPVLVSLEPERFGFQGRRGETFEALMARLVRKGFRARLKLGSLLTGSLFVDLGFYPQAPVRSLASSGGHPEIPTLPSTVATLAESLAGFAERLQKLPLEDLADQLRTALPALRETLQQTRALMARLDTETAPQAKATLAQAQATLAALERLLAPGSGTSTDLHQALDEFAQAARALRTLADTLERHPESLLYGKGRTP